MAHVNAHGFLGDRVYAILDRADGKVATAKNPLKWTNLFAFHATSVDHSGHNGIRITLPDGTIVTSEQEDLNRLLSKALNSGSS